MWIVVGLVVNVVAAVRGVLGVVARVVRSVFWTEVVLVEVVLWVVGEAVVEELGLLMWVVGEV